MAEVKYDVTVTNFNLFPVRVRVMSGSRVYAESYLKPFSTEGDAHILKVEGLRLDNFSVRTVDARRAKPSKW